MPNELNTVLQALAEKIPPDELKQRMDGGRTFTYVEGWYAIQQANEIFGVDGWSYEVQVHPYSIHNDDIICQATVKVSALGVTRSDVGISIAPMGQKSQRISPQTLDMAIKGAVTDGLKRALRTFGNAFGNYLYDKDSYEELGGHLAQAARDMGLPSAEPSVKIASCPTHGKAAPSRNGGFYCPTKLQDGTWCQWHGDDISEEAGDDYGDLPYA